MLVGALKSVLGYIVDEEFEEWKAWFNSHSEPDGTFDLGKHPDLCAWMENWAGMNRPDFSELNNTGESVSFDLSTLRRG